MREPALLEKQQYLRLQELTAIARQRYLDAGGDPRRCPSGRKGDDYMTDVEREEAVRLMRQIASVQIIDNQVHCQGRSWKLTNANMTEATIEDC